MSYLRFFSILLLIFFVSELILFISFRLEDQAVVMSQAHADGKPVINEFLPHPSTGDKEWVELYVPEGDDVTNYWIDDDTDFANDSGSSSKKQITSVVQGSDSKHVVFQLTSSIFNNDGDTVALFASDGTLLDHYGYASDPGVDISIGRTPDGTGDFQLLTSATRGSPNSPPKPPDTATPAPTDKPAPTMKPTATPKPAKITAIPTLVFYKATENVLADTTKASTIKKSFVSPTLIGSDDARPTSILAANIGKSDKKMYVISKPQVLIKGTSNVLPRVIAVSIGGLFLVGCGILIYLKKQGIWPWNKESSSRST